MKINVIEGTKRRLVFELEGADNTFCNILKKELQDQDGVINATYSIRHPLAGVPKFIIETNTSKSAKEALQEAVKGLQAKNKEFLTKFGKAVA